MIGALQRPIERRRERRDERRRYIEWDVTNWSVALGFWKEHTRLGIAGRRALELGSRHGGLSLWLAHNGAIVTCSDLNGPSPRARALHDAASMEGRIEYAAIDALAIPYVETFDLIVFKSMLGAIGGDDPREAQATAIRQMHRALRPGGELLFAENLAASPVHRALRRRFVRWGDRWQYVPLSSMLAYLAPFRDVQYRTLGFCGAFGRSHRQRALLGAIDRAGFDRLVPAPWRYIVLGVARK